MKQWRWGRAALVAVIAAVPVSMPFTVGTAQAQQETWAYDETVRIVNAGDTDEAYDANVKVSRTTNLFDRQQVAIELDDFKLTYNANNTGTYGAYLEYPVLVMQCRGADPTPETCANERRSVYYPGHDAGASQDWRERAKKIQSPGNEAGFPGTGDTQVTNALMNEQIPFIAADGTHYLWDESKKNAAGDPLIDLPALKSYRPQDTADGGVSLLNTRNVPIRKAADSDRGVSGTFLFEVRERVTQPSLGCSDTVACSIVVVPIMDVVCAERIPPTSSNADCVSPTKPKGLPPGSVGSGPTTINAFLSQRMWLADGNWRNRFVVPISFAPDAAVCGLQDPRPRMSIHGSELADVAQQRWGAAYCAGVRQTDYLPEYSQGPEYDARRNFTTKLGDGYLQDAILTTQPVVDSPRPVVHAPSALTGFAVAFTIDDAFGDPVEQLTLSPRLLAKLLTQSYVPSKVTPGIRDSRTRYTGSAEQLAAIEAANNANAYYWEHPEIYQNPENLFQDEEFLALNPDLRMHDADGRLARQFNSDVYPVVFQAESDIILDLTSYLAADPAAREWLDGKPDEQGMTVNPVWKGTGEYQLYSLLDSVVRPPKPRSGTWYETNPSFYNLPGAGDECDAQRRTPLMTRYANITNSAEKAATDLINRRGSATPRCTHEDVPVLPSEQPNPVPPGENPTVDRFYSEAKSDPAEFGQRAMIAITTVGHARLYELPAARLVNAGGHAVAPEPGTMANALAAAVQDETTGTIELDYSRVTGETAYPGTMIAFTAAPTAGLPLDVADNYADFIEFMATDGQVPGDSITDLPPGYDPLTPNLRQQALDAARAVREQKGEVPPIPEGGPLGGGFDSSSNTTPWSDNAANDGPPGSAVNPQGAANDAGEKEDPRNVARTEGSGSWLSRWALPLLLALGAVAALAAFVVGAASQPDHPARRLLRTVLRR